MVNRSIALGLLLLAVGCGPQTRTYNVTVRNSASKPITLALTKDGPPYEDAWASPEEIVQNHPSQTPGFVEVAPGRGASLTNVKGEFNSGVHAILRIYRGDALTVQDLLHVHLGPDRQDVLVNPGENQFIVTDDGGALHVK